MGLFSFGKKKKDDVADNGKPADEGSGDGQAADSSADAQKSDGTGVVRDPRKARPWFDRAKTVADTANYDYAIECFVNGLRWDPDAMAQHEALRDVALRRKVAGGKPPGIKDKFKKGKTPLDKMLIAEQNWAKDPLDPKLGLAMMEHAVSAELEEVAYWIGAYVLESNRGAKKEDKSIYRRAAELFAEINAYDKAVEALNFVLIMTPTDMTLREELKNMQAEATLQAGRYDEEGGSFRKGVKDADKQQALQDDDSIAKTSTQIENAIARHRAEYEDNPEDFDRLRKLVKVLLQSDKEEYEEEAIKLLTDAHERSGQYRFRMQVGDIRIKQYNRKIRKLKGSLAQAQDTGNLAGQKRITDDLKKLADEQVRFELAEYKDRVKNYPTDMRLRYMLGIRQLALGELDEAIGSFQEAKVDPKIRSEALKFLGEAFFRKEWFDEAIDTFRNGVEVHSTPDDKTGLELRYSLMKSLEHKARDAKDLSIAEEAAKIASQIAQVSINYRDSRDRLNTLRDLVAQLRRKSKDDDRS